MEEKFQIYPIHIDTAVTLSKGRKYGLKECVSKPNHQEIKMALERLHIDYIEEPTKKHPKDYNRYGRCTINKIGERKYLVNAIVHSINEERHRKSVSETKNKIPNKLNLVPIKKKKGKKNK